MEPIIIGIWIVIYYLINTYIDNSKLARNCTSAIHASSVFLLYMFNMPTYMYYISTCYYIFDGLCEICILCNSPKVSNLVLIIHHAVAVYAVSYLYDPQLAKYMLSSFVLIEISNFPVYLAYHFRKTSNNMAMINLLLLAEVISFVVLRVIMAGVNLVLAIVVNEAPTMLIMMCGMIYVISILWTVCLALQLNAALSW